MRSYRWWCVPGDVLWANDEWVAVFLSDSGLEWGIHVRQKSGSPAEKPNWLWDLQAGLDYVGKLPSKLPGVHSLEETLARRTPRTREQLSRLEIGILDSVSASTGGSMNVSGKQLRVDWKNELGASKSQVKTALAKLDPRLVTYRIDSGGDVYGPTPMGVLQSHKREEVIRFLESTLFVMRETFLRAPITRNFPWEPIAKRSGLDPKEDHQFANNVLRLFGWSGRSEQGDKGWMWDVPSDIEDLSESTTLQQYFEYCKKQPMLRPWPTCPAKLPTDDNHQEREAELLNASSYGLETPAVAEGSGIEGACKPRASALAARLRVIEREFREELEQRAKAVLAKQSARGGRGNPTPLLRLCEESVRNASHRLIDAHVIHGVFDAEGVYGALLEILKPAVSTFVGTKIRHPQVPERSRAEVEAGIDAVFESFRDDVEIAMDDALHVDDGYVSDEAPMSNKRIFLVHGHNAEAKLATARFLEKLGLEVTILHEKPNEGRTLFEKFEAHSDAAFAVILLTADDVGASREKKTALTPRARQNVILELGYFIGKLSRSRVCALYERGVEIPSDYLGVAYVLMEGEWKNELARELRAAGVPVDLTALI